MALPESQNERDGRVEALWRSLDPAKKGHVDLSALKDGLRRIDHPLQDAHDVLQDVIRTVGKDGKVIHFEDFRKFVEHTEKELYSLFTSIDTDRNGRLSKAEVQKAFQAAGLRVPPPKLERFFSKVDGDKDGSISLDEWRKSLLFLPLDSDAPLKAVFGYYSTAFAFNAEGDAAPRAEHQQGLGYFAAGGIAGAVSRTATAPLDRLKVYLIANIKTDASVDVIKRADVKLVTKQFGKPLIDATKALWQAGGLRSLFAGNGLNVFKVMPESAIKFGSYEAAKRAAARLEGHEDPTAIGPLSQFIAGGVGGMVSQAFVYPLDTLKFRMQCETVQGGLHGNALILATARKMYQQGALHTAYRGLVMGMVGMFPYAALDLGTFEFLKKQYSIRRASMLKCKPEDAMPGSFATGCIGAFSGAFGASVVYPVNLLRTRLQAQGTVLHPPTYTGVWDVASKTIKHEGWKGLFKGITPNLLKVVPSVSITYVVYENSKKFMSLK